MHAKYDVSISYGSKVIAKVKVDNRQTNRQTDKQDTNHSIRGHENWCKFGECSTNNRFCHICLLFLPYHGHSPVKCRSRTKPNTASVDHIKVSSWYIYRLGECITNRYCIDIDLTFSSRQKSLKREIQVKDINHYVT